MRLVNAAFDVHADDPTFGYRFIAHELAELGFAVSERRVWRLCSQQQLRSVFAKKKGPNRKPGPPVHDDRVQRIFTASRPYQLRLTDITEHKTGQGELNLCAVKDVFSNRIVGYSIDSSIKARLAVDALTVAVTHREHPTAATVHSGQGSQFRSRKAVRVLAQNGLLGSMGKMTACGDNAAMKSLFALLQKNP